LGGFASAPSTMALRKLASTLSYPAMLGVAAVIFMAVRQVGEGLQAQPATTPGFGSPVTTASAHPLLHVLLALLVIILCGRMLGFVFAKLRQPPVIGEVIAGIALGPSLLGRLAPEAYAFVLPANVAPMLSVLAQIGVVLYMFVVGLSLDLRALRGKEHTTIAISHASIVFPFTLGGVLALFLYPRVASSDVPFTVFALFVGVSLSVTAFPVLARILTDRRVHKTRMGVIALTCAAADDVTAWCLLAVVVGVARANLSAALLTIGLTLAYILFAFVVARPWVEKRLQASEFAREDTTRFVPAAFTALIASALITEAIGVHAIFGAFLLGAIVPSDSALAKDLVRKLESVVTVVFLPAFFAFTGMRTQLSLVSAWSIVLLIIVVASAGKFLGSAIAARVTGLSWRDASALGILMNTRGLMELIVLNIGYDLKILSPELFAMLVIMAVATTLATAPILSFITDLAPASAEPVAHTAVGKDG
jgi:Kef-type K+ transport system membrane component KefB